LPFSCVISRTSPSAGKSAKSAPYPRAAVGERGRESPSSESVSVPAASCVSTVPASDFGAQLLSADGMLRISSTSKWDVPARHVHAIDATPVEGNLFHTESERNPWAEVVLAGPSTVKGVVIENGHPNKGLRGRAVPLEVQISEDGKEWKTVFEDATVRDAYRVDLTANAERSRRVRVRRKPGAKEEPLHFTKILVYGNKLY